MPGMRMDMASCHHCPDTPHILGARLHPLDSEIRTELTLDLIKLVMEPTWRGSCLPPPPPPEIPTPTPWGVPLQEVP